MRMVQEFAQVLARVLSLKQKADYGQALSEIYRALKKFEDIDPAHSGELSLEDWIALCREETGAAEQNYVALADLLKEQGELYALEDKIDDSQQSRALALGLYLETLQVGIVSVDLLEKVEHLIKQTQQGRLPPGILRRMLGYLETRGRYAKAEDALFAWLETSDPVAVTAGAAFYERLIAKSDDELSAGDLPRDEVAEGKNEFQRKAKAITETN